jgi:hypothetical protein
MRHIYELVIIAVLGLFAGYFFGRSNQTVTFQKTEAFQELRDLAGNPCQTLGTTMTDRNQIRQQLKCGKTKLSLVRSYHMVEFDPNQDVAR